jgi:peptidoglycan/LPS O-acetylase OafA/YrhL
VTATPPSGTTSREEHPRFPVLDSLRALAALGVLTTHTAFQTGDYVRHGIWGSMLARLDVGVAVFFVLSGFLLSRPYLARARDRRPHPSTGRYLVKRLLRVYPVYVVTVVLALTLLPDQEAGPLQWVRTLLLADVFTTGVLPVGLSQMWSLSVEATFYLLLPLLMAACLPRRGGLRPRRVLALLVAVVALACWWHVSLATRLEAVVSGAPLLWLPSFGTWFAVGIALALAHVVAESSSDPPAPVRALRTLGSMPGVCATAVLGLMLVVATPLGGPVQLQVATSSESTFKHLVYAVVGGLVVLTGVFTGDGGGRYARALSARVPRHLGLISYSTFCIHLPLLTVVMSATGTQLFEGHGLRVWTITVVLSLAASEVLYRLVERPGMRLKNLRRRPRDGAGTNSAATTATTR